MRNSILFLIFFVIGRNAAESPAHQPANTRLEKQDSIFLADPTIFFYDGTYYLYGTGGIPNHGFLVYTSKELKTWKGPQGKRDGYALVRGESYGTTGFWAPQVFKRGNTFYMAYTANENIAIAKSDSPLGPFTQEQLHAVSGEGKQIDPYVFFDKKGKPYLYHVRLKNGNRIFVAEMNKDISDIKPETVKECITATEPWENTQHTSWPVTEGPTVLRLKKKYYLFYSANDFRNIDYAMGYAVADHPNGPWKKLSSQPVISRANLGRNGTGHGDFTRNERGEWLYVFHTHRTNQRVSPRVTAIIKCDFTKSPKGMFRITADTASLFYPAIIVK